MSKDPLDLPARRATTAANRHGAELSTHRPRFTERQMDTLMEGGAQVAEGVVSIAKSLVEIANIRAQSAAEVAGIQARSEAVVEVLRAQTEQLMANRKSIRTRGEAAALVIDQVMKNIPEGDERARQKALSILPQLVRIAVAPKETQPGEQP